MSRFLVGSYTDGQGVMKGARGEGVSLVELDCTSGALKRVSTCAGLLNPSYLARDPGRPDRFLVACENFIADGEVALLELRPDGCPELIAKQASPGMANCHVVVHRDVVIVSAYTSGLISVFPYAHGELGELMQQIRYQGSSVVAGRQESPHAHQTLPSPGGDLLYVCDLGSDVIWMHHVGPFKLSPQAVALQTPPGSGPRHMVFHPRLPVAYILCELSNEILVASWDAATGRFDIRQSVPGPEGGGVAAAAIRIDPSGRMLCASYRGANVIHSHGIAPHGTLAFEAAVPSGGEGPRDFCLAPSGDWLIATNQHSGVLCSVGLTPGKAGFGGVSGRCEVGSPVCVVAV